MTTEQPKKPLTAFFLFLEEQRAAIVKQLGDQAKVKGMVSKTAAEQWRNLPSEAKSPYNAKATATKAEYDKAVESFKAMGGTMQQKKRKAKFDMKPKKDKNAPKKPAGGGYGQFLIENREKIVKSLPAGSNPITEVSKAAGEQWKALSENDKKPYEEKYRAKMEEFRVAMEAYKVANPAPVEEAEDQVSPVKRARKSLLNTVAKLAFPDHSKIFETTPEKTKAPKRKAGSATKRGRGSVKSKTPEVVEVDATVLVEAQALGFEAALRNLARRDDVKALGKSDTDLLAAIKKSDGLVNPARHALLGGA